MNEIEKIGETTFKEARVKGEKLLESHDNLYQKLGDPDTPADPATLELAKGKIIGIEAEARRHYQHLIEVRDKLRRAANSNA